MAENSHKIPTSLGGFELLNKIGQGGMGAVFKARQISLDRIVALKILPPSLARDETFIGRFQREARVSAKLNHPNIVQGIAVGKDEPSGLWYFAMEFVDGPSLKTVLDAGPLPESAALQIARDVARALECAQSHGVVHRDIKPDNILMSTKGGGGGGGGAKLADLGLARQPHDDASLTQSGKAVGTPNYMAPEQVRGKADKIDTRADLYALGATLFHLVTGRPPFQGETSAVIMSKHLTDKPPLAHKVKEGVSEECSRMIVKLMNKQPEKRYQSARELAEQLDAMLAIRPTSKEGLKGVKQPVTGLYHNFQLSSVGSLAAPELRPKGEAKAADTSQRAAVRTTGPRPRVAASTRDLPQPVSPSKRLLIAGAIGVALAVIASVAVVSMRGKPTAPEDHEANAPVPLPVHGEGLGVGSPPGDVVVHAAPLPQERFAPPKPPPPAQLRPLPPPPPDADRTNRTDRTDRTNKIDDNAAFKPPDETQKIPEKDTKVEPAAPAKDELANAQAAYEKFSAEFLSVLVLQRDATPWLKKAEDDPSLKPVQAKLAQDRRALRWLEAGARALAEGAKKLADADDFELLVGSQSFHVGKRAPFHFKEFKNGVIDIESQGMSMPCDLARLAPQSRARLAAMGFADDAQGLLARAFTEMLAVAAPGGPSGPGSLNGDGVRAAVERAKKAGAAAEDVTYILDRLKIVEQGKREVSAGMAIMAFDKAFAAKKWKETADSGEKLLKDLTETEAFKAAPGLKEHIETAIRKASPVQEYSFTLQEGQPAPEIGLDKYAGSQSAPVYGWPGHMDIVQAAGPDLRCSGGFVDMVSFALLKSEGGPLPPETEILEARLHLYKNTAYSPYIELHRLLTAWKEREVSWNSATKTTRWTTPGGDLADAVAASLDLSKDSQKNWNPRWCDFDVTDALREALKDGKDGKNFGWRINVYGNKAHSDHGNILAFSSTTHPAAYQRPKLELKIRCPRLKNVKE